MAAAATLVSQPARCQGSKPELVVIGTVHNETPKFREDTLGAILARLRPDVILLEFDPTFFDSTGALKANYRNLTVESRAATKYANGARVTIRPYDIDGRNRFYQENDYFAREIRLNQDISRLHAAQELGVEARSIFDSLLTFAAARDTCAAGTIDVMNSAACDSTVLKKAHYAFKGFARIVSLTPTLATHASFCALADRFWTQRNDAMVANIVRHVAEPGVRRVVVLAGFEHRYYLRRELAHRAASSGFTLLDQPAR